LISCIHSMQSWPEFIMPDEKIPIFGSYGL
jgi:hypothetical protein